MIVTSRVALCIHINIHVRETIITYAAANLCKFEEADEILLCRLKWGKMELKL